MGWGALARWGCLLLAVGAMPARASEAAAQETAPPADEPTPPAEETTKPPAQEERSLLDRIRPRARLLLGVDADEREEWARRYGVQQARLGITLREELYRVEVEADLAETSVLNDAWIELRAAKPFRFRIGRFKEPFGLFRTESSWDLPIPERPAYAKAAQDLGFGGRDLGATLRYDLAFFELQAGLFQGTGVGAEAPQETGIVRLTAAPFSFVELGTSLGRRAIFDGGDGNAIGFDAKLALLGFGVLAEWQEASNVGRKLIERGGAVLLSRRMAIDEKFWFEPALGADSLEGSGNGLAAGVGVGLEDRFVARVALRRAPRGEENEEATKVALQMGVQL